MLRVKRSKKNRAESRMSDGSFHNGAIPLPRPLRRCGGQSCRPCERR